MPLGFGRHSNRSEHALDDSPAAAQRASNSNYAPPTSQQTGEIAESELYDARVAGYQAYQNAQNAQNEGGQPYIPTDHKGIDPRVYQDLTDGPSRSPSQRFSVGYITQPRNLDDDNSNRQQHDFVPGEVRKSHSISGPSSRTPQPGDQKKSRAKAFFNFTKTKNQPEQAQASQASEYNNLGGLGRKPSKSQKSPLPQQSAPSRTTEQHLFQPGYRSVHSSDSHLPSPQEGEEDFRNSHVLDSEQQDPALDHRHGYDPRVPPSIRIARSDQDPSTRVVEDSPTSQNTYQQQQQQQQFLSQKQRLVQQQGQYQQEQFQQQASQHPSSSSEYLSPQQAASHQKQLAGAQIHTNIQYPSAQNPEVVSQLSHESPTDNDTPSSTTQSHPSIAFPSSPADQILKVTSIQDQQSEQTQSGTMPPPLANSLNRRSTDAKSALGEGRPPPPGYSQQFAAQGRGPAAATSSTQPIAAQQGTEYRGSALQREYQPGSLEQGRDTPSLTQDRASEKGTEQLDYERLVAKYKKVKSLYFEKTAQVENLQNTLANQRLSQSRTSLDDNEYATRFNRLDGAIKEIAFSIRKDWKSIPLWLTPYVNADAQKVGTKEMTAVGRASISRWIYDEIFCKCFHPGLEVGLSADLKRMERNIRSFASTPINQEEENALTSKVIQWKLTTVDALANRLSSQEAVEAKADFSRMTVTNLTSHLINHLVEPTPQGIEGNATSIVELAVGICMHLAKESREIFISYPQPGNMVHSNIMKIEGGIPGLETSVQSELESADSTSSGDKDDDGERKKLRKAQAEKGKPTGTPKKTSLETDREEGKKVRFAGFMSVEVKGRQMLCPAPVWTL